MVVVETEDGQEFEVFLKPSGRPGLSVTALAHELVCACVAGFMGLPVCRPFLVEIHDPDWLSSIQDADIGDLLATSNPVAFGSLTAGRGWRQWTSTDVLFEENREAALGVFAFDAFVDNPDRKPSNPNLLIKGRDLRIIDHELALWISGIIPAPAPWIPARISWMTAFDGHALAARLRGSQLDFQPIHQRWSSLTDDILADYEATVPDEWAAASGSVSTGLAHIRLVRDRIDDCVGALGQILS